MPWKPADARRHTKKAKSGKCKRAFAHAANSSLRKDGDEGKAVRIGNKAAAMCTRKSGKSKKGKRVARKR